jgi:hypothetical protein
MEKDGTKTALPPESVRVRKSSIEQGQFHQGGAEFVAQEGLVAGDLVVLQEPVQTPVSRGGRMPLELMKR